MAALQVAHVRDSFSGWGLTRGRDAVWIDFGSGAVLDRLEELGVDRITDVLVTHHHRDGVEGLARVAAAGARIWVPPVERALFTDARGHWSRRRVAGSYDVRQDSWAPLE